MAIANVRKNAHCPPRYNRGFINVDIQIIKSRKSPRASRGKKRQLALQLTIASGAAKQTKIPRKSYSITRLFDDERCRDKQVRESVVHAAEKDARDSAGVSRNPETRRCSRQPLSARGRISRVLRRSSGSQFPYAIVVIRAHFLPRSPRPVNQNAISRSIS